MAQQPLPDRNSSVWAHKYEPSLLFTHAIYSCNLDWTRKLTGFLGLVWEDKFFDGLDGLDFHLDYRWWTGMDNYMNGLLSVLKNAKNEWNTFTMPHAVTNSYCFSNSHQLRQRFCCCTVSPRLLRHIPKTLKRCCAESLVRQIPKTLKCCCAISPRHMETSGWCVHGNINDFKNGI